LSLTVARAKASKVATSVVDDAGHRVALTLDRADDDEIVGRLPADAARLFVSMAVLVFAADERLKLRFLLSLRLRGASSRAESKIAPVERF